MKRLFMVFYVLDDSSWLPMVMDSECEGAVCVGCDVDPLAAFESRAAARKAIRISTAYAKLQSAQGKPANDDFLGDWLRSVKIMPVDVQESSK